MSDQFGVCLEDVAQVPGRIEVVLLDHLEQGEEMLYPGQVDAFLAGQGLDHSQLADVALRVAAPVGRRPEGLDEADVLVQHQRPRVGLEDLRGDADRVERLVEVEAGANVGAPVNSQRHFSFSHPSTPLDRFAGVAWLLMRYSSAPSFRPLSTSSRSP